jgi:hypothetical protein
VPSEVRSERATGSAATLTTMESSIQSKGPASIAYRVTPRARNWSSVT